ncbi:hypothetical protein SUGI_0415020 [Cryptomeria japonica]|nr:hypothetical protein SUGI_0415020 [Cryptomeria japonica]
METHIAEIFTFSNSAKELWDSIAELYGNQNNVAHIFELTLEIAAAQQGEKTFSEHLGNLKKLWDELNLYRPHTTDAKTLLKGTEEDKIFSLLSSLKPEYEYIRSNLLMDATLPTLAGVCATIQREETLRKTMRSESKTSTEKIESNVLLAEKDDKRKPHFSDKNMNVSRYKGKKELYQCDHCKKIGHTKDRCWELHPHLKSEYKGRKDHAVVADTPFSINQLGHLLQQLSKTISSSNSLSTSTYVSGSKVEEDDCRSQGESLSDPVPLPTVTNEDVATDQDAEVTEATPIPTSPQATLRSSRETRPPERMKDFFTYHATSYPMQEGLVEQEKKEISDHFAGYSLQSV